MKILAPSMQNLSSGSSGTQIASDMYNIVYSNTRPNDLENGLWIKNNRELPLLEIDSEWNRIAFDDTSEITIEDISSQCNTYNEGLYNFINGGYSNFIQPYISGNVVEPIIIDNTIYSINTSSCMVKFNFSTNVVSYNGMTLESYSSHSVDFMYNGTVLHNSIIYIFGAKYTYGAVNYTYKYDTTTNTCSKLANMPIEAYQTNALKWVYNNKAYAIVWGGYRSTSGNNTTVNHLLFKYDISNNTYTTLFTDTTSTSSGYQSNSTIPYRYSGAFIKGNYLYILNGQKDSNNSSYSNNAFMRFSLTSTISTPTAVSFYNTSIFSYASVYNNLSPIYKIGDKYIVCMKIVPNNSSSAYYDKFFEIIPENITTNNVDSIFKEIHTEEYAKYYLGLDTSNLFKQFKGLGWIDNNKIVIYSRIDSNTYYKTSYIPNYPIVYDKPISNTVSFYPVLLSNSTEKPNIDKNSLYKLDTYSSLASAKKNCNNLTYSKLYCINKIYKPDYSGEEQEAWIVVNGVWTNVSNNTNNSSISSFKNTVLLPSPIINKQFDSVIIMPYNYVSNISRSTTNTIENYTIDVNNSDFILSSSNFDDHYVYYSGYSNFALGIRASIIPGYDSTVTFTHEYANELMKHVRIEGYGGFYCSNIYYGSIYEPEMGDYIIFKYFDYIYAQNKTFTFRVVI